MKPFKSIEHRLKCKELVAKGVMRQATFDVMERATQKEATLPQRAFPQERETKKVGKVGKI